MNNIINNSNIILTNYDLRQNPNKYSIAELENNIMDLDLIPILHTQHLTPDFCIKYILSEEYASSDAERYLVWSDVLCHQPHITKDDLYKAWAKYYKKETESEPESEPKNK